MKTQKFRLIPLPGQCKSDWWETHEIISQGQGFKMMKRSGACFGIASAFGQIVALYLWKGRVPRRVDVTVFFEKDKPKGDK